MTSAKLEVLPRPDRLESWKEIAAYLGRSERTVRRWESHEGLPVHRLQHDKRGSVYAYARELDHWRESRQPSVDAEPPRPPWTNGGRKWRWGVGGMALIVVVSGGMWLAGRSTPLPVAPNPQAVRLVERASVFGTNAGRTQIATAIRTYQEAIRIDPAYAPAWSGLAAAHLAVGWFGESPTAETIGAARTEAEEAIRLDPSRGRPWRVLAFANHYFDYNHAAADAHFRKALELGPGDSTTLSWYGDFLTDLGRFDEARRMYVRAQEARPTWLEPISFAANVHYFRGHAEVAIAEYERVLEIEPGFGLANHFLGRAQLAAGRTSEAVSRLRRSDELLGRVPFSRADLGHALARAGRRTEAEEILSEMMNKRREAYYPAFSIATILLGLDRADEALDWIEKAVDERHVGFYFPSIDPFYDSVRAHPRFRRVLERLNVSETGR